MSAISEKIYTCKYSYIGMETEGAYYEYPPVNVKAIDEAHALHKYYVFLWVHGLVPKPKQLNEYLKEEYASGGWGMFAEESSMGYIDSIFSDLRFRGWNEIYKQFI